MTTVVNIRDGIDNAVVIDRRTIFGNPFRIEPLCSRTESIALFTKYFINRMDKDEIFRRRVQELKDKKLACWCAPLPCHGNVIAAYLDCRSTSNEETKDNK